MSEERRHGLAFIQEAVVRDKHLRQFVISSTNTHINLEQMNIVIPISLFFVFFLHY